MHHQRITKNSNLKFLAAVLFGLAIWAIAMSDAMAQLQGSSYAQAKAAKKGTFAFTYVDTPGFVERQADGTVGGICVDIMDEFIVWLKNEKGITMDYAFEGADPDNFTLFMNEVRQGKGGVVGLGNITVTEARKKVYTFSPPFIVNISVFLSHRNAPTLKSLEEISTTFRGMKAYTITNSTNAARIEEVKQKYYPAMRIEYVSSGPIALEKTLTDPNSFTNIDFTHYLAAIRKYPQIKRHPIKDPNPEDLALIMPKGSDWGPLMAEFMNGFKQTSAYRKIIAENLGANALRLLDTIATN